MEPRPIEIEFAQRVERLRAGVRALESVAVAFSGGVDSSVLLLVAHQELGERACGVIADSPSLPRRELAEAVELAARIGARLEVVSTDELENERYRANSGDRCYWCKTALFEAMEPWARARGFRALAFGEITDDFVDDRPGARAAREFGVVAPLSAAGLSKEDVRRIAREAGLDVADKPASACLASRLPIGTRVDAVRLARIEAAEEALRALGLRQLRVRDRGQRARVEVAREELDYARTRTDALARALEASGFAGFDLDVYLSPAEKAALPR